MVKLSKHVFIVLFFILISVISVAFAETNQSTTADEGVEKDKENPWLRVTILSLILVAMSCFLSHYMDDHDGYARRLRKLQYYRMQCKSCRELSEYMNSLTTENEKEVLEDCIRFRITLMHFGPISFTLIFCFLVATLIVTYLFIEFYISCELNFGNLNLLVLPILSLMDIILLSQLWFYLRQGNRIAHWIKNLEKIQFKECCEKYQEKIIIHPRVIEEWLTKVRLWFARVNKKKGRLNLYTDIVSLIWVFILVCSIYFFCFCG